jgi:hypothetical protein
MPQYLPAVVNEHLCYLVALRILVAYGLNFFIVKAENIRIRIAEQYGRMRNYDEL